MPREQYETHWEDYYEILQVHPEAEAEIITAAYRKLAQMYHPDHNNSPTATQRFQKISEAYEVLSNLERRARYNELYQTKQRPPYEQYNPAPPQPTPQYSPPTTPSPSPSETKTQPQPTPVPVSRKGVMTWGRAGILLGLLIGLGIFVSVVVGLSDNKENGLQKVALSAPTKTPLLTWSWPIEVNEDVISESKEWRVIRKRADWSSALLHSSDGGITWQTLLSIREDSWHFPPIASLLVETPDTIKINYQGPLSGLTYETTDGGITWEQHVYGGRYYGSNTVERTTADRGQTWQKTNR